MGVVVTAREYPVFVPAGDERLCAVVCAPEDDVRDLGVALLTGGNFTRTHTNAMWVRAARELADRGFASIRLDYHGVGDSTGEAHYQLETPFDQDVVAASDFLCRAAGTGTVALVATCFGGRSAIAAAARDPRVSWMTIYPIPVMIPRGQRQVRRRTRVKVWLRRRAWGEKLLHRGSVRRMRRSVARQASPESPEVVSPRVKRDLVTYLRRGGRVRFVYGSLDPNLPALRQMLAEIEPHLSHDERGHIEVEVVEGADIHRYSTIGDQDEVVRRAVDSVEAAFALRSPARDQAGV